MERPDGGLDDLAFTTVTQVCQAIYPRLKAGGATVTYRAASQAVVPVLPSLWPQARMRQRRYEEKTLRSPNVVYVPRTTQSRVAYQTTNNKPGVVVFRIDSPTELTEVSAAVRFGVRVPPPPGCDFHLDLSLDGGQTWSPMSKADIPPDNEYSSGWMFGRTAVERPGTEDRPDSRHFYNGGHQAGLIDVQLYGLRRTASPQAATLTYGWKEESRKQEFTQTLAAGTREQKFVVPTGGTVVDEFVRIAAPD